MQRDSLIGENLGQYHILDELGQGGMATVYKAWQPSLRRYVAIKVLHHRLSDQESIQRFQQEAIVVANLSHPHIVTVYEVAQQEGTPFIVMEYVEGRSLSDVILQDGPLPMERLLRLLGQIASALDYAHQRRFVHRDIKPSNILVTADDRVVVTDFGIAKALEGSGATVSLTAAGTIIGTPTYMSPEQIKGEPIDYRTDLYSLGVVCYEMLGGRPPFGGTTTAAVLYAQVNTQPPSIRGANPNVSPSVENSLTRMLSKAPTDRFPSATAFVDSLARGNTAVGGTTGKRHTRKLPETALGSGGTTLSLPWGKSISPVALLGGAIIAIVVILGGLIAVALGGDSVEELLRQGAQEMDRQNYAGAEEAYAAVLEKEPDNVVANQSQGDVLLNQGRYTESVPYYQAALAVDDTLARAHAGLGWAYYYLQDYQQAVGEFTQLIALRPAYAEGYEGKGRSYYALAAYEDAEVPLKTWAEMRPENADAYLLLGFGYHERGLHAQAAEQLAQAMQLSEPDAKIYQSLANSYRALGESQNALNVSQEWAKWDPTSADAFVAMGWAWHDLQQHEAAVEAFTQALDLQESASAYRGLGDSCYRLEDYNSALVAFRRWAEMEPGSASAQSSIAWTLNRLKRYDDAIEAFLQAIEMETRPALYQGLGDSYFQLKRYDKALDAFREWAKAEPEQAAAHNSVGWTLLMLKDCTGAVKSFEKALSIDPNMAQALDGLERCPGN